MTTCKVTETPRPPLPHNNHCVSQSGMWPHPQQDGLSFPSIWGSREAFGKHLQKDELVWLSLRPFCIWCDPFYGDLSLPIMQNVCLGKWLSSSRLTRCAAYLQSRSRLGSSPQTATYWTVLPACGGTWADLKRVEFLLPKRYSRNLLK